VTAKDIISRDTLKRLTTHLAHRLFGLKAEAVQVLETQNQRIEDRRADLVARMRGTDGEEFLLHVEIANNSVTNMPLRMLRYYTDIRFAGHPGPIRQFLIYIGADPLTMPAGLDEPELLDYRYGLVDMHRVDCVGLLEQDDSLDALVLAVLCDFGDRRPQEIATYIVHRLRELLDTNERGFRDYMNMLEILSENRDLLTQVKEAEHMLTQVDVERLPSFTIGFEQGEKKGLEQGMEKGMERGREEGKAQIVHHLLSRFGVAEVSELLGLPPEDVERIAAMGGNDETTRSRH